MTSDLQRLQEELAELDKLIAVHSQVLATLIAGLKERARAIVGADISEGESRKQQEIRQALAMASHQLEGLENKRVIKRALLDKLTATNQALSRSGYSVADL